MMTGAGWSLWNPSKSGFFLLVVCTWQGNRGYQLEGPKKMNNPAMQPLLWEQKCKRHLQASLVRSRMKT
ncbi:unnamed protein product [Musa acuminata subsp. malaccensis]|uniref:(wild Malaysian banana) hypothetical protein n=1 Tax=Musa acuminata subsp. malaccensis TaxID=214687 RepID=A0A804IEE6_MUSAM|nr:unnamed protein product [Musa acuminata subsp. malaccensis]